MWSWFRPSETDRRLEELRKQLVALDAKLQVVVTDLAESLVRLRHLDRPKRVVSVQVQPVGESVMDQLLSYEVLLPVLAQPNDVVERRIVVSIGGVSGSPVSLKPADSVVEVGGVSYNAFPAITAKQGESVRIEAVDIDDANNMSAPVIHAFTATDTIPPAAPSGLTVRAVDEKFVASTPAGEIGPVGEPGPSGQPGDPTEG